MAQQLVDLGAERRRVGEVADADGAAPDLVLIGGADAAAGGADLAAAAGALAGAVELAVQRQDQRHVSASIRLSGVTATPLARDRVDLLEQVPRDRPPRRCR